MYVRTSRGLGDVASAKSLIVADSEQYGVDPNLALAVAKQESGYQQTGTGGGTLKSSAGALGVMQLLPSTAAGLGVDPNDESQNIAGGVKLLSQLLQQFNGDVTKALAAYNAGPVAVQKYNGVPPYPETQNYVASIMANYQSASSSGDFSGASASADAQTSLFPSFDFSSLLPSSDSSVDLGGLVLSESQLAVLGLAIVGGLLVFSIL